MFLLHCISLIHLLTSVLEISVDGIDGSYSRSCPKSIVTCHIFVKAIYLYLYALAAIYLKNAKRIRDLPKRRLIWLNGDIAKNMRFSTAARTELTIIYCEAHEHYSHAQKRFNVT